MNEKCLLGAAAHERRLVVMMTHDYVIERQLISFLPSLHHARSRAGPDGAGSMDRSARIHQQWRQWRRQRRPKASTSRPSWPNKRNFCWQNCGASRERSPRWPGPVISVRRIHRPRRRDRRTSFEDCASKASRLACTVGRWFIWSRDLWCQLRLRRRHLLTLVMSWMVPRRPVLVYPLHVAAPVLEVVCFHRTD